jgi:hypothetical protein
LRIARLALWALLVAADALGQIPGSTTFACVTRPGVHGSGCIGFGLVTSVPSAPATTPPEFEFAPASGAGMGLACAGTTPTMPDGGTVTFPARAGNRTCMKGGEFSNIANGDLVILGANKYAIQPGGDGTGPLGVSVWTSGKNWTPGSEAISGADWAVIGSSSAPTITANHAVAPDGTTTAERVQAPATGAGAFSFVFANAGCSVVVTTKSLSCFFRGTSTSGTIDFAWGGGTGGWDHNGCSYVSTSWARCRLPLANAASASLFSFGNMTAQAGLDRAAADFLVWGCQCEDAATVSPYMPTAIGGTATRAAESAPFASFTAAGGALSIQATPVAPYSFADDANVASAVSLSFDVDNEVVVPTTGAKVRCDFNIAGSHTYAMATKNLLDPAPQSAASCSYAGSSRTACLATECRSTSGALALPTGAATIWLGGLQDGGVSNMTVKNVCVDNSGTLCMVSGTGVTCPPSVGESSTIALFGNSIMVGVTAAAPGVTVEEEMNARLCGSSRKVAQFGASGAKINTGANSCLDQYTTNIKGHAYAAAATECGINDIINGTSGVDAWAMMESLLADVVYDGGFHVVLGNLAPCHGYSGCDTAQVLAFNAAEANWCADAGSRATCLNHYALLGATSTEKTNSTTTTTVLATKCIPSTDNLHPNGYCTVLMSDSFAAGVP